MHNNSFFLRLILILILLGAFIVRLYGFSNPVADWHSWRQADTSAVSRNFVKTGFDVFHPKFDDLSNVPSGLDNPNGYRFVEFPLYNIAQAGLFTLFPLFSIEASGRLVTILGSLFSIFFLSSLVSKYAGNTAGLFTAFFFAFLPYNIYYGRVILPDPSMVMASLGGIYFFDKWIEESSKFKVQNAKLQFKVKNYSFFFLSLLFTTSAFLIKPYALIFTLPMLYLVWAHFGFTALKKWQLWIFVLLAVVPLIGWRIWIQQYPEGIPGSEWLFNGGNIRFKGAYFYWIFADRIGRLILGYWGLPLLILGILAATKKEFFLQQKSLGFFLSFLASSLIYLIVIARGNVQHDYYQILIIPSLVIFLALGAKFLLVDAKEIFLKPVSYLVLTTCIIFMGMFGWYIVRDYFNINNMSIVIAGKAVDTLTPKNAKVLAIYDGDTSFLYQTNRKGWASFQHSLPEMVQLGANYLVLVNPRKEDIGLAQGYTLIKSEKEYLLIKLQ